MTLVQPQNLTININNNKDNIQYLNKDTDQIINPIIIQNLINMPANGINSQNNTNKIPKVIFSTTPQINNLKNTYNNSNSQTTSNSKFDQCINKENNSNEDSSLKENKEPLDNIKNQININNKLIKPNFCGEPIYINNLNNAKIHKSLGRIKIRESAKFKKRRIFNKFKVYRMEPKKEKEKLLYKLKHKRKYKPDDIRKKIKARFHKSIKNIVNENLRQAGSKYLFSFLPQIFISSISREKNHQVLNMSYRDLIKKDFVSNIDEKKYKNKRVDLAKYKNNLIVLDYLDKNPEICEKSGFDLISKMKYGDLLEEYFKSDEFDKAIKKLYEENEEEDYIKEYISKAKTYVKFFSEVPFKININKFRKKSDSLAIEISNNKKEEKK
jgi:primosomal protein N''